MPSHPAAQPRKVHTVPNSNGSTRPTPASCWHSPRIPVHDGISCRGQTGSARNTVQARRRRWTAAAVDARSSSESTRRRSAIRSPRSSPHRWPVPTRRGGTGPVPEVVQVDGLSGECDLLTSWRPTPTTCTAWRTHPRHPRVERTSTALVMRRLVPYRIAPLLPPYRRFLSRASPTRAVRRRFLGPTPLLLSRLNPVIRCRDAPRASPDERLPPRAPRDAIADRNDPVGTPQGTQERPVRIANLSGRLVLVVDDRAVDVKRASDGRFAADPQAVYDRWEEFRAWAARGPAARGRPRGPRRAGARATADRRRRPQLPRPRLRVGIRCPTPCRRSSPEFATITGPITEVVLPPGGHTDWEIELVRRHRHPRPPRRGRRCLGPRGRADRWSRGHLRAHHATGRPRPSSALGESFGVRPDRAVAGHPGAFDNRDDLGLRCTNGRKEMQKRTG